MKTVAALIIVAVALLLPSSLSAATISFEHPFLLASHEVFPGAGAEFPEETLRDQWFSLLQTEWDVPAFDPTLGTPIVLFLDLVATTSITFTIDPPDASMPIGPFLFLIDPVNGRADASGYSTNIYPPDPTGFHWVIETHADSHAYYDIRASATFDILISGTATATYLYEPAATAVPEPTTLLLLGSGLIGADWKRRRRNT